jgi:branched-chain amino acid aminotransferase
LLDQQGHVAEGSGCNLFLVRDETLITSPITGDILEGITRRTLMQFARDEGIPVEERDIDRSELYVADEAFFCGTGVQIAPIASIDGRPIGDAVPGPISKRIRELFFDTVRGRNAKYGHFLTRVRAKVASPAD